MSRERETLVLRLVRVLLATSAMLAAVAGCGVQMGADYPAGYYDDYPPDAYIATTEPFYYEGHPTYWYGGRWYFRDGARWQRYDREPSALYQRRVQAAPMRRAYEPSRMGRPMPRPAVRARPAVRPGGGRR